MAFAFNEAKENWQIISNECHWSHDGKIDFLTIFATLFTRFTRDPYPIISQCKKSVLRSLIEKQVITIFIVTGIVRPTLDLSFSVCFCRF